MKRLLACAALVCCAFAARGQSPGAGDAAAKRRYVGLSYGAELPAGHQSISSWLIPSADGSVAPAGDYGVSIISRGRTTLVWFERLTRRGSPAARREVMDAVVVPPFNPNRALVAYPCYAGDEFDPELLALVEHDGQEFFTKVRRAWRANRRTNKLEQVPARGIKCQNEGFTS